jgi:hypothetical protein
VDPAHRYRAEAIGQYWGVLDCELQTYIRNWHRGLTRTVWRTDLETATEMADTMNALRMGNVRPVAQELSKSQKIMFANKARKRTARPTVSSFTRCAGCARMVKQGHQCEGAA